jgi:ribonuclease T1
MRLPFSNTADPQRGAQPQWAKIAFYVALLLLVVWLKYHSAGEAPEQEARQASVPPASAPQLPNADRGAASDDAVANKRRSEPGARAGNRDASDSSGSARSSQKKSTSADPPRDDQRGGLIMHDMRILDEDRRVVYRGDVDLAPTLDRIERGERLRFSHDGIVFENRERRLPKQPSGYYREYVQPTLGESGPGAQRLVIGEGGEVYYSSNHYKTFRRVR